LNGETAKKVMTTFAFLYVSYFLFVIWSQGSGSKSLTADPDPDPHPPLFHPKHGNFFFKEVNIETFVTIIS